LIQTLNMSSAPLSFLLARPPVRSHQRDHRADVSIVVLSVPSYRSQEPNFVPASCEASTKRFEGDLSLDTREEKEHGNGRTCTQEARGSETRPSATPTGAKLQRAKGPWEGETLARGPRTQRGEGKDLYCRRGYKRRREIPNTRETILIGRESVHVHGVSMCTSEFWDANLCFINAPIKTFFRTYNAMGDAVPAEISRRIRSDTRNTGKNSTQKPALATHSRRRRGGT
jgi:hypothetical protein